MAKYNYSRAPKAFPNLIAPYTGGNIPSPNLTNSPKIEQLIHDGKLEISLQDAVELALQNSMDIEVARLQCLVRGHRPAQHGWRRRGPRHGGGQFSFFASQRALSKL
jgi:hypothetical protein